MKDLIKKTNLPKWKQVQQLVLDYIRDSNMEIGSSLPSDKEFVKLSGYSLQPVIRAMNDLVQKGVVTRFSGASTKLRSRLPEADDQQFGFGYTAKSQYDAEPETRVIEMAHRTPGNDSDCQYEMRAAKALGLNAKKKFLALTRVRSFEGIAKVIHRTYVSPEIFGDDYLVKHNFEKESLISIYNGYGYKVDSRETTISARYATKQEQAIFKIEKKPILAVEQTLMAVHSSSSELFCIEYLAATYLDWEYRITNRIASRSASSAGESK